MYITTFFSFKGGVGRTLALVNVGAELMRRGKRVLLVDFDLEAPGLTTFPRLQARMQTPGLVDFVARFIATRCVPNAAEFIYEASDCREGDGRLWVMPAGLSDDAYARRLATINWEVLYREQDGFLLFEDLKEQWKKLFNPDYVLIDSRTGHTEITGICTRQLADSVCILFFPNDQNLLGLKKVVREIREEEEGPRLHHIDIHFVMSNVPDLDDEDQIIAKRMDDFALALGYRSLAGTIHRYDSLALLNQSIFVLERPMSRLTREYRALTDTITRLNLEDPSVAIDRLIQIGKRTYGGGKVLTNKLRLEVDAISKLHPTQPRVLHLLARVEQDFGNLETALRFIQRSIDLGNRKPAALLFRAELLQLSGDTKAAEVDALEALDADEISPATLKRLVGLIRRLSPASMPSVPQSRAMRSIPPIKRIELCEELLWSRPGAEAAARMAGEAAAQILKTDRDEWISAKRTLLLCLMAAREFNAAVDVADEFKNSQKENATSIDIMFNRACGIWGMTGRIPSQLFAELLLLDEKEEEGRADPNYEQCMAFLLMAMRRTDEASTRIRTAAENSHMTGSYIFSSWRFLNVSTDQFRNDCDEILNWDQTSLPKFIRD